MDIPQNFRSALNGFRREDVVRYLEYLNAKHTTQVNQLTAEADSLREQIQQMEQKLSDQPEVPDCSKELEDLRSQLSTAEEEKNILTQMVEELSSASQKCDDHHAELEELRTKNAALEERCAQLEAALETKPAASQEKNLAEQELEAYRRAERAERIAQEKADLIYHRANTVLDEASDKIDGASGELTELADRVNVQLQQMQCAINSSKMALKNALDTMQALHTKDK